MSYLVSWLVVVAILCLLGAIGWSLYDAHRSVEAGASASANRIQHQLQALYWQKLLWNRGMSRETLVPQPEWQTVATLNIISPGVCVTFAPPHAEAQRLCSQVEALGPVAPAWFATLDGWLFGQHRPIVRPLSVHEKDAGTVTTAAEPSAALRQSWNEVLIAARVAAATAAATPPCSIARRAMEYSGFARGLPRWAEAYSLDELRRAYALRQLFRFGLLKI
jgi:hypothetical protein